MTLILYKHHVARHFDNGWTPNGIVVGVGVGGHMHQDLRVLIEHCLSKWNEPMSIARITCNESDVKPVLEKGQGWYEALKPLIPEEGFMPLDEARKRYLKE